jgi:molecular chaperone GrpE (heat shock protein)
MSTPESAELPEPIASETVAAATEAEGFTPDALGMESDATPAESDEAPPVEPLAVTASEVDESGPEAPDDSAIVEALARIEAQLSESQRLLDRQADISAKLHAENQVLRGGELRKAQTAIVLSILRVFDDVNQMAATAAEESTRNDLSLVADALADALARNGVDSVVVEPGVPFDGRGHKIAMIEQTGDPEADRTVARVTRSGFVWSDGEVVRVSDVAVYKYTAPTEPEPVGAPEPDLATPTEQRHPLPSKD